MTDATTPPESAALRRRRVAILALLFLATLLNYVDRQVLSILKATLSGEMGWSDQDYARIVVSFQIAYAIGQAGSGVVLDRIGLRLGFVLAVAAWSLAGASHVLATSLAGFCVCRFLLGLTEAANWPAATKTTGEWFPPRDRAFATGIWNTGSATGAVVAAPLVTWIALRFAKGAAEGVDAQPAWQPAFLVTAALGALWIVAWRLVYRPREAFAGGAPAHVDAARAGAVDVVHGTAVAATRGGLLRRSDVWGLFVARFVTDPVWWFYLFWLPGYLEQQRGFTLVQVGLVAWIPYLAADAGSVLGGLASSALIRRGVAVVAARKRIMLIAGLLTPFATFAAVVDSSAALIACVSIATFAHQFFASSMLTLPADLFRGPVVATCSGISGTGATLGGILATLCIGGFVAKIGYGPLFVIAGLMHPLAAATIYALVRRREGPQEPAAP